MAKLGQLVLRFCVPVSRFSSILSFSLFFRREASVLIDSASHFYIKDGKEGRESKINGESVTYMIVKWRFTHNASERVVVLQSSLISSYPLLPWFVD
jgi:hypothetical protein